MQTCGSCVYFRHFTQEINGKFYETCLCDFEDEPTMECNTACDAYEEEE